MFGAQWGVALGLTVLALETAIPLVLAAHVFRRRDF
jgi:biopolymer transport protein ExbB/TolQ